MNYKLLMDTPMKFFQEHLITMVIQLSQGLKIIRVLYGKILIQSKIFDVI